MSNKAPLCKSTYTSLLKSKGLIFEIKNLIKSIQLKNKKRTQKSSLNFITFIKVYPNRRS